MPPKKTTRNGTSALWTQTRELVEDAARPESTELPHAVALRVVALYRYTVDQVFALATREPTTAGEAYDIVLADERHKIKCVLSTALNDSVRKGAVLPGALVEVRRCAIRWDETAIPARCFLLVQHAVVVVPQLPPEDIRNDVTFYDESSRRETDLLPLASSRRFYRSFTNDDDFLLEDERTTPQVLPSPEQPLATDHISIKELVRRNGGAPLLGLVARKSRISHYAKPEDHKDPYPFKFHMEICDNTASIEVVVWNHLAMKLFASVEVGHVLLLDAYKIRRAYGKQEGVEVHLNERNPAAVVRRVRPESDWPQTPNDQQKFRQRFAGPRALRPQPGLLLKDNSIVDIEGWIVYLGRCERELLSKNSLSFIEYRYVLLQSGPMRLVLKLTTCSHPLLFYSLQPGDYLRCANVKIVSYTLDSRRPRTVIYMTTFTTQPSHLTSQQAVQEGLHFDDYLHSVLSRDGFFRPQVPLRSFRELTDTTGLEPTYFWHIVREVSALALYERRSIIVQGFLSSVHFADHFHGVRFQYEELDNDKRVVKGMWRRRYAARHLVQLKTVRRRDARGAPIDHRVVDTNAAGSALPVLQQRRAAALAQQRTFALMKRWPVPPLSRGARTNRGRAGKTGGSSSKDPSADGVTGAGAGSNAAGGGEDGDDDAAPDVDEGSEDDGAPPEEFVVNPVQRPDAISSSQTDVLASPAGLFNEEEGVGAIKPSSYRPVMVRLSSMDELTVVRAVCQPRWRLDRPVPRGPLMQGFLDVLPPEFDLHRPGLTLESDEDFLQTVFKSLDRHAGDTRPLVFHLDLFRQSAEQVQLVLVGVHVPTADPGAAADDADADADATDQ